MGSTTTSNMPGLSAHFMRSRGQRIAAHAKRSVSAASQPPRVTCGTVCSERLAGVPEEDGQLESDWDSDSSSVLSSCSTTDRVEEFVDTNPRVRNTVKGQGAGLLSRMWFRQAVRSGVL
jgi:hypothetical protein